MAIPCLGRSLEKGIRPAHSRVRSDSRSKSRLEKAKSPADLQGILLFNGSSGGSIQETLSQTHIHPFQTHFELFWTQWRGEIGQSHECRVHIQPSTGHSERNPSCAPRLSIRARRFPS